MKQKSRNYLQAWSDVLEQVGQEDSKARAEVRRQVEEMEAAGGPKTAEEFAWYYQGKKLTQAERDWLEERDTDFLTVLFHMALASKWETWPAKRKPIVGDDENMR